MLACGHMRQGTQYQACAASGHSPLQPFPTPTMRFRAVLAR
jgi:hypothetical protein